MLIYIAIAVFLLLVCVMSWLVPRGTFLGFFFAFVWGVGVFTFLSYFIFVVAMGSINRMPLKAGDSRVYYI